MKRKLKKVFFVIIILLFIFVMLSKNVKFKDVFDDILFLKDFRRNEKEVSANHMNRTKENDSGVMQYMFEVSWKNTNFNRVNLMDTINSKTLINEKIAPGLEGTFDIILKTNANSKYYIKFENQTEKPKNLRFKDLNSQKETNTLEELEEVLVGNINRGDVKKVSIYWFWPYESDENEDIQDTKDSKNIGKYIFDIYVIGEAM